MDESIPYRIHVDGGPDLVFRGNKLGGAIWNGVGAILYRTVGGTYVAEIARALSPRLVVRGQSAQEILQKTSYNSHLKQIISALALADTEERID